MSKKTLLASLLISVPMSMSVNADSKNIGPEAVQAFENLFGVTKGKRRNHTKGFCFDAQFSPIAGSVQSLSTSGLFSAPSKVTGRFSHSGGNPNKADNEPDELGMALAFNTKNGEQHLMAMNTLDFFPVATPEAFVEFLQANAKGPEAVKAFSAKNKEIQKFVAYQSKKKKSVRPYESVTYNSINSFYLVDKDGKKTAVRWSFKPVLSQDIVVKTNENFLFDNIKTNLKNSDVTWNMIITLADEKDDIDNPSIAWQGERKQLVAGTLRINSVSNDENSACENINYDPLVLSSGFAPSNDPLLAARRAAYAITFGKRLSEKNANK